MRGFNSIQCVHLVYILLLGYICFVTSEEGKGKCSRKEKVTKENNHKIAMMKRIPSRCSNWDRSWTWITKADCGTKYVTTYVEYPIYVTKYFCCPDDKTCKENQEAQAQIDSEERFLVITFGSATAALAIIVLIIVISICHRRQYRSSFIFWKRNNCEYVPTSDKGSDLSLGCHMENRNQNEYTNDNHKFMEPEYEEICDRTSQDWCRMEEKLPVLDRDVDVEQKLSNDDKSEELLNINESDILVEDKINSDDYSKLNSFMEYVKDMEAKETLQKESIQSNLNNDMDKDDKNIKTDNINKRCENEYTDFGDLVTCETSTNCQQSSESRHEYEQLDNTTRELSSTGQMYSTLSSSDPDQKAQSLC